VYPDGHAESFLVVGREAGEAGGTVVRRLPDTGFEILVPPVEEGRPLKFRASPTSEWKLLGTLHVAEPPAAASATQPQTRPVIQRSAAPAPGPGTPPATRRAMSPEPRPGPRRAAAPRVGS
jgi:hypothetical protein